MSKIIKNIFFFTLVLIWFSYIPNVFAVDTNTNYDNTNDINLTSEQKEKLKNNFFIPLVWLYKKVIVDKQISDLIWNISISISVGNKVPVWDEINMIHDYLLSYIPDNVKTKAETMWNKSDFIRSWLLPWIASREYGWAKVNNPKNWYGNFQITAPNVCGQIIIPNSIIAWLGRQIYFTPPNLCQWVYKLCTYKNKNNITCKCWNKDYRALQAKMLNWKDGFNANQWISMYDNFCKGKDPDTNVFASLRYPFQYWDFIWFVYNKVNGYKNWIYIAYNMKNGMSLKTRKILSLSELIKRTYWIDEKKVINWILDWYIKYLNTKNVVLADLSEPSLDFPINIDWQESTYQKALIYLADKLKTDPNTVGNLFNSYQMAIVFSKYNGLGNVWKQFFDNSYVSNLTSKWAENLGLKTYYIFWKITKDYCTTCIWKDAQMYGAMIYANIYNQKSVFLQYLLMQLFPNMARKWLFNKLMEYNLF